MKKAQMSQKTIMALIVMGLVIIVGIVLFRSFYDKSDEAVDRIKCQQSVEDHLRVMAITNTKMEAEIDCPTEFKTIEHKDEDLIMYEMATDMKYCWDLYKHGEEEFFSENEAVFCQICTVYEEFRHKDKELPLFDFLTETPVMSFENTEEASETYMQYFGSFETRDSEEFEDEIKRVAGGSIESVTTTVDTNKEYAVIFYMTKDQDTIKAYVDATKEAIKVGAVGAVGSGAIAGTAGAIVGASIGGTLSAILCSPGLFAAVGCAVAGAKIGAILGGGLGVLVGGAYGAIAGAVLADEYVDWLSAIMIREYNAAELKALGCEISK